MESTAAVQALNPNENSLSQPSKKSRQMLSDKDGDQCVDDEHPSEIVLHKSDTSETVLYKGPSNPKKGGITIGAFTVQCGKCSKWRLIPTKEEYEKIRASITVTPFDCEQARKWKPGVTCDDPTDVSQDDSRIWAIDKPNIALPPKGWERLVMIRSEGSCRFADVYYKSPTGKKIRSLPELEKYLKQNPEYDASVESSQFSFVIPSPLQRDYVKKRPTKSKLSDGAHTGSTKPLEPLKVMPLSWAPPAHEDLADYMPVPENKVPPGLQTRYGSTSDTNAAA